MSTDDNWMAPEELRAIAEYCESLTPFWDALTTGPRAGVTIESESMEVTVYDSNGDTLGRISWGDDGPAFFLTTTPAPTANGDDR